MKHTIDTIENIHINAKEWFHKNFGNSYFSGIVIVNKDLENEQVMKMPFQYGYDEQYRYAAKDLISKTNEIELPSFSSLRELGIIVKANIETGCRKKEVETYGK